MKHKFFNALDETPFVLFLASMSNIWIVAGILIIILCIINGAVKLKDLPMALFVVTTAYMSFWLSLVVIVAYVTVRTLDFHSVASGRKRLN